MTQNATQANKSRSFTEGVNFRLSSYYSLVHTCCSKRTIRLIMLYTQSHNKEASWNNDKALIKFHFYVLKSKCFHEQTKIHCGFPEQINLAEPNWRDGVFPELHLTIALQSGPAEPLGAMGKIVCGVSILPASYHDMGNSFEAPISMMADESSLLI